MKTFKQTLVSLLLVLALLPGPAAQAADRPTLSCEPGTGTMQLDLKNLDGTGVYGVQLELTLRGAYPDCTFTPDSGSAYSPDCTVEVRQDQTAVTIYLTDRVPLNDKTTLSLGTLALGTAGSAALSSAKAVMLDRSLRELGSSGVLDIETAPDQPDQPDPPEQPDPPNQPDPPDQPTQPDRPSLPNSGTTVTRPSEPNLPEDNAPVADPVQPAEPDYRTVVPPFTDVKETDWFYEAVQFVYAKGMMNGASADGFVPGDKTTRGMLVTILHRLEGSPAAAPAAFTDVPAAQYYAEPVAWAAANGIVGGFGDGTFQPNTPVTREQMAAILYRYVQMLGLDVSVQGSLAAFPDAASVAPYAQDAMTWATGVGLIQGTDGGRLDPAGDATRAQVAVILMRLCQNVLGAA